jgi:Fur family transcriptional regulator, ferric uptake regulator
MELVNLHNVRETVRGILTNYLEANNCRKTPERYAILDAIYNIGGYFTMDELIAKLAEMKFLVSRATLYNAMRLFIELRLVVRHRFQTGTKYEACYACNNHCHLICTTCGKVMDSDIPEISKALSNAKIRRFRKDCYSLYVYGICISCQNRLKRDKKTSNKEILNKKSK